MIEEVKEQMIAASTGCRGVGSGQDGPDLRLRERLDQGAVKTLERNGQHLAGQGQGLWRLLGHIAHEGAQGGQPDIAGAGLAAALFLQVIQEAQDGLRIPVPEGLLAGMSGGLLLDESQQEPQRVPIAGQGVGADLSLGL